MMPSSAAGSALAAVKIRRAATDHPTSPLETRSAACIMCHLLENRDIPVRERPRGSGLMERRLSLLPRSTHFTGVPSLAGLPALSLPVGFDPDGMPVGMRIIGRPFDEGTLFRIGHAYQGETDWH